MWYNPPVKPFFGREIRKVGSFSPEPDFTAANHMLSSARCVGRFGFAYIANPFGRGVLLQTRARRKVLRLVAIYSGITPSPFFYSRVTTFHILWFSFWFQEYFLNGERGTAND